MNSKILIVNINPAYDLDIKLDNFSSKDISRPIEESIQLAGKGVNVARYIRHFNVPCSLTGFLGNGNSKLAIDTLKSQGVDSLMIEVDGLIRINPKIKNNETGDILNINCYGTIDIAHNISKLEDTIKSNCETADYLVLAGSMPKALPQDYYKKIINTVRGINKNIKIVVDSNSRALLAAIESSPYMIKPNIYELQEIAGEPISNTQDAINVAIRLKEKYQISNIIVSMGSDGALFITDNGIYKSEVLKVDVKSIVGAGDSMVGSFVVADYNNYEAERLVKFVAGTSISKVTSDNLELPSHDVIMKIVDSVKTTKIS